jgi:FkbM family methyltransferase
MGIFLKTIRFLTRLLPARLPEIVYTVFLRPKPLRRLSNRILLHLIPEQVRIDGLTLYLNPKDPVLSSAVAFGIYENYEADVFRCFCKEGATVVDVGANVGLYTVIAAARVGSGGRVVSIEPHTESFQCLQKTIAANRLTQVRSFNVAAGDGVRTVSLFLTDDNKADSRIYSDSKGRKEVSVRMVDLDHLLADNGIDRVDVIKMDIQGAEALALRGMRRILAGNPEMVIFAEFWPWGIEQTGLKAAGFLEQLRDAGFSFQAIDEEGRKLTAVETVDELVAGHRDLQYTGTDLRRSHANLLCVRHAVPASANSGTSSN